jgi:outer membrane immunogenic protein
MTRNDTIILGGEVEAMGSTTKKSYSNLNFSGDSDVLKGGRDLYVGGRLGAVVTKNLMLYAKAGYVNGELSEVYDDGLGHISSATATKSVYRARVGAELAFSHYFGRAEYRYTSFGAITSTANGADVKIDRSQVVVEAGYRF